MKSVRELAEEIKNYFSPGLVTDVYVICDQLGIEIIEVPIEADAYLECENGITYIFLKSSLGLNRKKFTIAHELGHFCMTWHSELMFGCDISEMDFRNEYAPREKEANMFAAELLMPTNEFRKYFKGTISYCEVSNMAQIFQVSFQAALNRCIDLSREDCMVICSRDKNVKWFKATEGFPYFMNKKRLSSLSGANDLCAASEIKTKLVCEPAYVWFSGQEDAYIEEESIIFPKYNEVISIIHLK